MKLYIVEAPVKEAATPYWARTWTTSQSEAAATRARAIPPTWVWPARTSVPRRWKWTRAAKH